jgi:hypothetical protein
MLGRVDHGFVDIKAMALKAAISGSIFIIPDACFVMMMALPIGSREALATSHDINARPPAPYRSISDGTFCRLDLAPSPSSLVRFRRFDWPSTDLVQLILVRSRGRKNDFVTPRRLLSSCSA